MPDAFNTTNRNLIIGLAARYGVPASYAQDIFAQSGGLIAYSSVRTEAYYQVAGYIDRILKGEEPADLPVQAPTKFELLINMKTAKALGIEVPAKLLALADGVIE
jgi:putative tryptophan/tyrosine transport system substrate-binding protein